MADLAAKRAEEVEQDAAARVSALRRMEASDILLSFEFTSMSEEVLKIRRPNRSKKQNRNGEQKRMLRVRLPRIADDRRSKPGKFVAGAAPDFATTLLSFLTCARL